VCVSLCKSMSLSVCVGVIVCVWYSACMCMDLSEIVELNKQKSKCFGYKDHPYDPLLDIFEPGMTVSKIRPVFNELKNALVPLVKAFHSKPAVDTSFLEKEYDELRQREYAQSLLEKIGLGASFCSLDLSAHPFCSAIFPTDIRLTTHIFRNDPIPNIFATLHEGGHGLYHAGIPKKYFGTPLKTSASHGLDESQSRLYETIFGHSKAFWEYEYPYLQEKFPENLKDVSLDVFYSAIHKLPITPIRIHSDELTYCLHIILRFEIEIGLIEGSIEVEDLPELWNDKMEESIGIRPKNDSEGVLQDLHWSAGAIGYFPTYAIGNIYAAQIHKKFVETHSNYEEDFRRGVFSTMRSWLKTNIHEKGRSEKADDIIKSLCSEGLNAAPYIKYLSDKYKNLP